MSNANGIDSEARTARLHPSTPHYVPYIKERKLCHCGGHPQPVSSREMSYTKDIITRALLVHGDGFWDGGGNAGLIIDMIEATKKAGYDIIVKRRK